MSNRWEGRGGGVDFHVSKNGKCVQFLRFGIWHLVVSVADARDYSPSIVSYLSEGCPKTAAALWAKLVSEATMTSIYF